MGHCRLDDRSRIGEPQCPSLENLGFWFAGQDLQPLSKSNALYPFLPKPHPPNTVKLRLIGIDRHAY